MEKIKLVIWDLDDTFWKGTLSEGEIVPINQNIELVKELCNRGIMNSIVSKNDFDKAKQKLIKLNVWNYFIFPSIAWQPKGQAIKEVIKNCQLRDVNVLFIDDNHLNLEEAKHYNPSLHVISPNLIDTLLARRAFIGKDDRNHTRLKQYKLLEKKHKVSLKYSDNTSFLRDSNIQIETIEGDNLFKYIDRIYELLERTNQLNFTKIRSSKNEIENLLNNINYTSVLVKVFDKFGDYGIVGFYSINKKENFLKHFTFSCRIINLGVAQYIYSKLGFPKINIIPEVSEKLDRTTPDWISEVNRNEHNETFVSNNQLQRYKIFFKGGCDLDQMLFYLGEKYFDIVKETNYVCGNGLPIHQEHTEVLLGNKLLPYEEKKYIINNVPFTDENFYHTDFFDANYHCVIYSVLMDYTQDVYISKKNKNIKLPFGGYGNIWTDDKQHSQIIETFNKRGIKVVTKEKLKFFSKEFICIGQITPNDFYNNLLSIRNKLQYNIPLIIVNGAEVESPNLSEKNVLKRHKIMNSVLDKFVDESKNTYLLDMRLIVKDSSQLLDSIRHYKRGTYKLMSIELLKLLNEILKTNIDPEKIDISNTLRLKLLKKDMIKKIKKTLGKK